MKNAVLLILTAGFFLAGHLKGIYHWHLMREKSPNLKQYKSRGDFMRSMDMRDPIQYWQFVEVTHRLLLPSFLIKESSPMHKNVKIIRILSLAYILFLILLALVLIDLIDLE